jgi:hypothetical protein
MRPLPSIAGYVDENVRSQDEAQLMLNVFRNELTPQFPFVVISPTATFGEVREKKPFLLLVVVMIACRHDVLRQGTIAMTVRDVICQRMLINSEQSLDMLQGMLLYLAWYTMLLLW